MFEWNISGIKKPPLIQLHYKFNKWSMYGWLPKKSLTESCIKCHCSTKSGQEIHFTGVKNSQEQICKWVCFFNVITLKLIIWHPFCHDCRPMIFKSLNHSTTKPQELRMYKDIYTWINSYFFSTKSTKAEKKNTSSLTSLL